MTATERLDKIADDLDGAIRVLAGMAAVYEMPEATAQALGAFAETLGEIAQTARETRKDRTLTVPPANADAPLS